MNPSFRRDFWALARANKGYYSWARKEPWRLYRALHQRRRNCGHMCGDDADPIGLVQGVFEEGLCMHPLLDIAFDAFARAEARLCLRFVPQGSHEERLTGHLISELEAAILMVEDSFTAEAEARYSEPMYIDFAYSDLSRGGQTEKTTGGDFGLILVVDLPDRPKIIRYAAIQAKRVKGSTSLDKDQFDTLSRMFGNAATYLFYDCEFNTLAPPMMMRATELHSRKAAKDVTDSFAIDQNFVFTNGTPLSLWLLTELGAANAGESAVDFQGAINQITGDRIHNQEFTFSRLAMVSIGRRFILTTDIERGLRVAL